MFFFLQDHYRLSPEENTSHWQKFGIALLYDETFWELSFSITLGSYNNVMFKKTKLLKLQKYFILFFK